MKAIYQWKSHSIAWMLALVLIADTEPIHAQQTVFYSWLRYNQQRILPAYYSSDYWATLGAIELSHNYILPYFTTDFTWGEGGFFILKKDGKLDSVHLWDRTNYSLAENNLTEIERLDKNLIAFSRRIQDTFGKNAINYVFTDTALNLKKSILYSKPGYIQSYGMKKTLNNHSVLSKIQYFLVDSITGTRLYSTNAELLEVDTSGSIKLLYSQYGRFSNHIFEVLVDTVDSTYILLSGNDRYSVTSYGDRDTLALTKIKPNGELVWQYRWQPYDYMFLSWKFRPNILRTQTGYRFFTSYIGEDTSSRHLIEVDLNGRSHRIVRDYASKDERRDGYEILIPSHSPSSHYAFGASVGLLKDIAYDSQWRREVVDYSLHITKIDSQGNTLWRRGHNLNNPNIYFMRDWRSLEVVLRTSDGGFLLFGSANGIFLDLPRNQNNNYIIVAKTDSCGYGPRDTCQLRPRIDSIRYHRVYISLPYDSNVVCGRRWHVDGRVLTSENLVYSFPDTGSYTIGLWGFAGATVDSISFRIHIQQLDSCRSRREDICRIRARLDMKICDSVLLSIDQSNSIYCTSRWIVEGRSYDLDILRYRFPEKKSYRVYLIGERGISTDTSSLDISIDCLASLSASTIESGYRIYPNPARDILILESISLYPKTDATLYLYDALGREAMKQRLRGSTHQSFSLSTLPEGIYLLRITSDSEPDYYSKLEIRR